MTDPQPTRPTGAPPEQTMPGSEAPVSGGARTFAPDFLTDLFRNPLDAGYSDAAKRKAAKGADDPARRRFGFSLRMLALVATGLLLAVAYQQTIAAEPESSKVRSGLVSDVQQRQQETEALQKRADLLKAQVTTLRDSVLVGADAQALRNLEARVGVGAVTGDGATITLSDGPVPVDPVTGKPDTNPDHYLGRVLDTDLQVIANELWRDGAEAVAINGQRLTSTSTIRTAGSAILVDFAPLTQPYRISAIGPSSLTGRFNASATASEYGRLHDTYGMRFSVAAHSDLNLPAATDVQLRYATPLRSSSSPAASGVPPASKSTSRSTTSTSQPSPSSSGGR
jgi:uncharacterized protein YlxW (UPF0749 family)